MTATIEDDEVVDLESDLDWVPEAGPPRRLWCLIRATMVHFEGDTPETIVARAAAYDSWITDGVVPGGKAVVSLVRDAKR